MSLNIYDKDLKQKILVDGTDEVDSALSITSTNPVQNKVITEAIEEFTEINNNFGVKNLLPNNAVTNTVNGVTFAVNPDGSVTANGTSTAVGSYVLYSSDKISDLEVGKSYILSGGGSSINSVCQLRLGVDGSLVAYSTKNHDEHEFTMPTITSNVSVYILINASGVELNDVTFKPMIRPAYITDDTYEPYARSNSELTGEVEPMLNVLGAKNLLPNKGATQTINGVTFTVNGDGTVTANGTATARAIFSVIERTTSLILPKGRYIMSGCPSGGSDQTFRMLFNPSVSGGAFEYGNGHLVSLNGSEGFLVYIYIESGTTVSDLIFKPMLRLASIKDDTYVPYAKTNYELTNDYTQILNMSSLVGSTITVMNGTITKSGKHVTLTFFWKGSATNAQTIITVPAEFLPKNFGTTIFGTGVVYNASNVTVPAVYTLSADGVIRQQTTVSACTQGSATFTYLTK